MTNAHNIPCNICGGTTIPIVVEEQMMGTNEPFIYFKCDDCGHTHLYSIPADMSQYYNPAEYYSFKKGKPIFPSAAFKAFAKLAISKDAPILDYGCGAGAFVKELIAHEYFNAKGYDPYLPEELFVNGWLTNNLYNLSHWKWDAITLNHVFEHIENPIEVLKNLNNQLKYYGTLLLRFPVIDSYAFEKYRENWVQFDAPRHLNLFTRKSIKLAIEKAGNYRVTNMYDDADHFGFTGSDFYVKGQSLKGNSFIKRLLSFKTYRYMLLAKKLNKQNRGDRIVVVLQKI